MLLDAEQIFNTRCLAPDLVALAMRIIPPSKKPVTTVQTEDLQEF